MSDLLLRSSDEEAVELLELLANGEAVTFQTFGEGPAKSTRSLSRVLHGTLAEHKNTLVGLNARGAGVYWMVNAGDGKGRRACNVRRVRALFVDLDGSPLEAVLAASLQPHAIIESSPGRWHVYWRVADCPLSDFTPLQKALAARFKADPKVCDLPRVLRLPGFTHRKGQPYPCRIKSVQSRAPYTVAEMVEAFDLRVTALRKPAATVIPLRRRTLPRTIPEGERNNRLLSLAGGLMRRGFSLRAVNARLQRINAERCSPPLGADEVDGIAARAMDYGSDGFAMLTHALWDSPEWKGLPPPAHDVILMALRRYDGTNNGNIALTWADFEGREGFAKKDTFYRHRNLAVSSGILWWSSKGKNGQKGHKPDLFGIDPKWLRWSASPQKEDWPRSPKSTPLHR